MANTISKEEIRQENVQATISKTEQFYNDNKKAIWGILAAVVLIVLASLAYNKFIYAPKCAEAMEQLFPAEKNFQAEEYELALKGNDNTPGFESVIAEYGSKAGTAVYFYAGVCELQLKNYESAVNYLKKYNGKEPILAARAIACTGDAYVGLKDYNKAVSCYLNAAAKADNMFAAQYLMKAGGVYEEMGQNDKAVECYSKVKDQYPGAFEAMDVDKYIVRASSK